MGKGSSAQKAKNKHGLVQGFSVTPFPRTLEFQLLIIYGGLAPKKRGQENLTKDTLPEKDVGHPPSSGTFGESLVFLESCARIHDSADQKFFWPACRHLFGRVRSLVRYPPPFTVCPPLYDSCMAQADLSPRS